MHQQRISLHFSMSAPAPQYHLTSELQQPICFKVNSLKGLNLQQHATITAAGLQELAEVSRNATLPRLDLQSTGSQCEVYVEAFISSYNQQIGTTQRTTSRVVRTNSSSSSVDEVRWNEWLIFECCYSEVDSTTQLCITVKQSHYNAESHRPSHAPTSITIGSSTMPLLNKRKVYKTGHRQLLLHRQQAADPHTRSSTPHNRRPSNNTYTRCQHTKPPLTPLQHIERMSRKYESQPLPMIAWLDELALKKIKQIPQEELAVQQLLHSKRFEAVNGSANGQNGSSQHSDDDLNLPSDAIFRSLFSTLQHDVHLSIESPPFRHPLIHLYQPMPAQHNVTSNIEAAAAVDPTLQFLFPIYDASLTADNPIELMYHKLARAAALSGDVNPTEIKPSKEERSMLYSVISAPSSKRLSIDAKELLWKYRYSLVDDKRALVKFLRCINWSDAQETAAALLLLPRWKTPLSTSDALELLSSSFQHQDVRQYAVQQLQATADNSELDTYLLQLVQALRYENVAENQPQTQTMLGKFLIDRCSTDLTLATYFFWYLQMECLDLLSPASGAASQTAGGQRVAATSNAASNTTVQQRYLAIQRQFITALKSTESGLHIESMLRNESTLVHQLTALFESTIAAGGKVETRIQRLRQLLTAKHSRHSELTDLGVSTPMPVQPSIQVTGVVASETSMFKSALAPMLLSFRLAHVTSSSPVMTPALHRSQVLSSPRTSSPAMAHSVSPTSQQRQQLQSAAAELPTYKVIFKVGDDLRQDQLVVNMIQLFDRILKRVKLDLYLTPYRVLAVSNTAGFVEYVPHSYTLTAVLDQYSRDIRSFIADHNSSASAVRAAMNRFVRSCAGYSVITYLLGVGDRHGENVLLCTDGRLFHIDFAYLFGRDPKPFPPPMKCSREMVECMGGANGSYYREFRELCVSCYNQLRQHASLALNLLQLMSDASIADLSGPTQAEQTMSKVQEKFRLDLDDEAAGAYILALIDQSVNALFPQMNEIIHKFSTYWR